MISFSVVFYLFVILAGVIGMIRGWAKEVLVTVSTIFAIFVILILETYFGGFQEFFGTEPVNIFWTRTLIIILLAFFGYQTPNIPRLAPVVMREQIRDSILGAGLGSFNGYFIFGSIWYYLSVANYPFGEHMVSPTSQAVLDLLVKMPPSWIGIPGIYFAIAIAFTFVVIVFI